VRQWLKSWLRYRPSDETAGVRRLLDVGRAPDRPYCAEHQGDFIFHLITTRRYMHCIQTGFGTGSTALYMLAALDKVGGGEVVSIDWSETNFNEVGRRHLARSGWLWRHSLVEEPSHGVVARFLNDGRRCDFVFIDGWKTFDYLAFELFAFNRMLADGGCVMFDDCQLPSVRRAINLLKRHYGYEEVDYRGLGVTWRLRLFQILTTGSLRQPYRALRKAVPLHAQPPTQDWTFYRHF
jgi:predicted O-methyltransferase YrrM